MLDFRVHGGPDHNELGQLGVDVSEVLDFSANTNIYGPSPSIVRAISQTDVTRYPDIHASAARQSLATMLGCDSQRIALGNGAAELLWTLARLSQAQGHSRALIVEPTFCEFRAACCSIGIETFEWRATPETGFRIDFDEILRTARHHRTKLVYLCSPNSPTGVGMSALEIASWAGQNRNIRVVLDQSFLSLSKYYGDAQVKMPSNVVVVRSLTKDHAVPGVRIGYVSGAAELVRSITSIQPAWNLNSFAMSVAEIAPQDSPFVAACRTRLLTDRVYLEAQLRKLGLQAVRSCTVFSLVQVEQPAKLRAYLLREHKILIRDCSSYGLSKYIRIAARPKAQTDRLIAAIREFEKREPKENTKQCLHLP